MPVDKISQDSVNHDQITKRRSYNQYQFTKFNFKNL